MWEHRLVVGTFEVSRSPRAATIERRKLDIPTGSFERISKYPYFCENEFWVVRMPETYSLSNSTGFSSGGVRLATIERTPSRTLNGSSPSGVVPRPA